MFGNKGKNNGALDWLLAFRLKKVTFGKLGDIKKKNSLECKLQLGKKALELNLMKEVELV